MRAIAEKILRLLSKSYFVYKAAQKIVSFRNNENNPQFESNGEDAFLRAHASASKVIFDVGANVGNWTKLAHAYNPQAHIYAFEPFPEAFAELSAIAPVRTVHCFNMALGNTLGTKDLFTFSESSAFNSLYRRELGFEVSTISVAVTTIDAFCDQHGIDTIDFLKIDVEGAELAVLQGAQGMIAQRRIRVIQFEYGGTYIDAHVFLQDVFAFFANTQYQIYKLFPTHAVPVSQYDPNLENFQYANYAAIVK